MTKLFGGENAEQYEALMDAIKACAEDDRKDIYEYLQLIPKTSLVCEIVDKLHEMGFKLISVKE